MSLHLSLSETQKSLETFTAVLYHYANEDDPARIEADGILKQFKRLAKEIKKRAMNAKRVLRDAKPS